MPFPLNWNNYYHVNIDHYFSEYFSLGHLNLSLVNLANRNRRSNYLKNLVSCSHYPVLVKITHPMHVKHSQRYLKKGLKTKFFKNWKLVSSTLIFGILKISTCFPILKRINGISPGSGRNMRSAHTRILPLLKTMKSK